LEGRVGENGIHFIGKGKSDSYGTQIHHVQLLRESGCDEGFDDLIVNGDFNKGNNVGSGWQIFIGEMGGWFGDEIEIGNGPIYNSHWKNGQHICELDGNHNDNVYQKIYFDEHFRLISESEWEDEDVHSNKLILTFDHVARNGVAFESNRFGVKWNN